jgi:hypothetical protein
MSDSYEVTGLPGWLPHRTDRQVNAKDTAPEGIRSGSKWVTPIHVEPLGGFEAYGGPFAQRNSWKVTVRAALMNLFLTHCLMLGPK